MSEDFSLDSGSLEETMLGPLWARTSINPNWSKKKLKVLKVSERSKTSKIIHVKLMR